MSFLVKITLVDFQSTIYHKFVGFHFMQNQIKPKMPFNVRTLCILLIISILDTL